jgi:hypothetical protein
VRGRLDRGHQGIQALVELRVPYAECAHLVGKPGVGALDPGQGEALVGLHFRDPLVEEQTADAVDAGLVELVDGANHVDHRPVVEAETEIEPLDQLAVVDVQGQRRHGQPTQRLGHHLGDLDVGVEAERVPPDDVDVGLGELAVAALLRPLTAPAALDLVAPEREVELALVLQHVPG